MATQEREDYLLNRLETIAEKVEASENGRINTSEAFGLSQFDQQIMRATDQSEETNAPKSMKKVMEAIQSIKVQQQMTQN